MEPLGLAGLPAHSASVPFLRPTWLCSRAGVPESLAGHPQGCPRAEDATPVQESDAGGPESATARAASAGARWPRSVPAPGDGLAQESSPGADRTEPEVNGQVSQMNLNFSPCSPASDGGAAASFLGTQGSTQRGSPCIGQQPGLGVRTCWWVQIPPSGALLTLSA